MIALRSDHRPALALITVRQHQVLALLASGEYSRKQVARFLGITEATLKNTLRDTYLRLRVDNLLSALRATGCIRGDWEITRPDGLAPWEDEP